MDFSLLPATFPLRDPPPGPSPWPHCYRRSGLKAMRFWRSRVVTFQVAHRSRHEGIGLTFNGLLDGCPLRSHWAAAGCESGPWFSKASPRFIPRISPACRTGYPSKTPHLVSLGNATTTFCVRSGRITLVSEMVAFTRSGRNCGPNGEIACVSVAFCVRHIGPKVERPDGRA